MTDPVSLTFGIASLLQVIAQTSVVVTNFVRTYRKARADLLGIDQELSALKKILEWLKNDTEEAHAASIPESLRNQIVTIISHCNITLTKIKSILEKYSERYGRAGWAIDGKKQVINLQPELTAYRGALNITLITIDIVLTRDVKADTAAIRDDTEDLKLGQAQILAKIEELLEQIPQVDRDNSPIVQRYLESVASYAGSVKSDIIDWEEHIEESRQSRSKKDPVTTKHKEACMLSTSSSGGTDKRISTQLDGAQQTPFPASSRSPTVSLEDQIQPDNASSSSSHTYKSTHSELSHSYQAEPSDTYNPEEHRTLLVEVSLPLEGASSSETTSPVVENEPMEFLQCYSFPTDQLHVAYDQDDDSSTMESRQSLCSVSGNAVSMQSMSNCDSRVSLSSRIRTRTTIPLQSGNWVLEESIDAGKTGKVKMVRKKGTKIKAACRIIPRPRGSKESSSIRDIRIARDADRIFLLSHPHICGHIDILQTENHWYLILEHVDGGSLSQYFINHRRLKEKQARKFSREILSALDYCHQHGIVHRDLRPQNILLTTQGNIKLKGFVRDNLFSPNGHLMTSSGYRYFAAPEVLEGCPFTGPEIDVWSFGVILYRLVCGTVPFQADNATQLLKNIIRGEVEYKSDMNAECKDLISRVLVPDPCDRATLKDVMNDPWIVKGYNSPPPSYMPSREPLSLPLDNEIINKMTRLSFYSADAIKSRLTQITESEAYQRAAARVQTEKDLPGESQGVKQSSMQRIRGLYKRNTAGIHTTELNDLATRNTEMSVSNNTMATFDPLVHMYHLARDTCEKR